MKAGIFMHVAVRGDTPFTDADTTGRAGNTSNEFERIHRSPPPLAPRYTARSAGPSALELELYSAVRQQHPHTAIPENFPENFVTHCGFRLGHWQY